MTDPRPDAGPVLVEEEAFHRKLLGRSSVLPSAGNTEGRVTLEESMLGVAVLAPCFVLVRNWPILGLFSLIMMLPTLLRTHILINRRRSSGFSKHVGIWALAFGSSLVRVILIYGLIGLGQALCAGYGAFMFYWIDPKYAKAGAMTGFMIIGLPLTAIAVFVLAPRILAIRDPESE